MPVRNKHRDRLQFKIILCTGSIITDQASFNISDILEERRHAKDKCLIMKSSLID